MIDLIGNISEDKIYLPNGMEIIIDYGDSLIDDFGIGMRYTAKERRVRLFDKKGVLISLLIEDNPHKEFIPEGEFEVKPNGKVIY